MAKRYDVELEKKIIEEYENGMTPYQMVKLIPELKGKRPSVIYGILKRLKILQDFQTLSLLQISWKLMMMLTTLRVV